MGKRRKRGGMEARRRDKLSPSDRGGFVVVAVGYCCYHFFSLIEDKSKLLL